MIPKDTRINPAPANRGDAAAVDNASLELAKRTEAELVQLKAYAKDLLAKGKPVTDDVKAAIVNCYNSNKYLQSVVKQQEEVRIKGLIRQYKGLNI